MFTCYGCHCKFDLATELTTHMRSGCLKSANFKEFHCGEDYCYRHFTTAATLRTHLLHCHSNNRSQISKTINLTVESLPNVLGTASTSSHTFSELLNSEPDLNSTSLPVLTPLEQPNSTSLHLLTPLEQHLATFTSTLYGTVGVPRSVVQIVSNELSGLMEKSNNHILSRFDESLKSKGVHVPNEIRQALVSILNDILCSTSHLKTEYRRLALFQDIGSLILPAEVIIGQRMDQKSTQDGLHLIPVNCTMQVIPITPVLEKLFTLPGIMEDTLLNLNRFENCDDLENIVQGTVWKDIVARENDDCLHLPLILFYDDFEVGNPLGSHATVHKLGGVYLSLPFLASHYVSQLKCILLLALFHASDRTKFGTNVVFQKIFEQLNSLSRNGIYVKTNAYVGVIKLHVVCVTGDNLGLNSILGFVENFVANHYCRICIAHRNEMQVMLVEDKALLRTMDTYESDVLLKDLSSTGIKERCVLLDNLRGFKLFDHVSVDILHDFLEGTCRYVMTFVIQFIVVQSNLVPFNIIQTSFTSFNYASDASSKPSNCVILDNGKIRIKASAAEMITIVRYFGLITGKFIPNNCEVWQLYLCLRKILDRLLNYRVSENSAEQLKYLISCLNEMYLKLTNSQLKPKFHFLVHYPTMCLKFGPLTQLWTMRFEARHRVLKIAAKASCNRINLCKTVATKNQLVLNDLFLKENPFTFLVTGKKVKANSEVSNTIQQKFQFQADLYSVQWVIFKGTKIEKSSILTIDLSSEQFLPTFGDVKEIYVTNDDKIVLNISELETIEFDLHFYAYKVQKCIDTQFVEFSSVVSMVPNTLTVMSDGGLYVTVRMPFD